MKAMLLALVLALGVVGVSWAELCPGLNQTVAPNGYESLTVGATAVALTPPQRSEMAVAVLETADVRYRDDGTDPTASEGMLVSSGGSLIICSGSLGPVRFIATSATSGVLKVAYYRK